MKKKHTELINYLLEKKIPVTGEKLAATLDISIRSIYTYVNEINLLSNNKIIFSSRNGYLIVEKNAKKLLESEKNDLPQTSEERITYIIKQLLIEHSSHLNLYDLCDTLYVGYSTIKIDIAKMNKSLAPFQVKFICKNDNLYIKGKEKDIRKLVSYIIFEETNRQFIDISIIKDSFKDIDVNFISQMIIKTFKKYNYYINDFAFINLLLHFTIIINRIKEGNIMSLAKEDFNIEDEIEKKLITELCLSFTNKFDISLNKDEQFDIYMLFKINANYSTPSNEKELEKIVGSKIIDTVKDISNKVDDLYYIGLFSESFIIPFALHLKNLLLRATNNTYTKNPMTQNIKLSCPTVYDIATFISIKLMEKYHIQINEDEVAFLALHIGAEIERKKINEYKIKCALYCPNYMEIAAQIHNQLLLDFGSQIDIIKTTANEDDLNYEDYDLIITTLKTEKMFDKEVLVIPPFTQQINRIQIYDTLDHIHQNNKRSILKKHFNYIFSPELFMVNAKIKTKKKIIHELSNKLLKLDYVDENFEKNVLTRETAASTAFGNIAIPHSMNMDALKTCISVAIFKDGINWHDKNVNIVLLVAINKADKKLFHELYDVLVSLFSENTIIDLFKNCNTYNDFKKLLYDIIATNE